MADRASLYSRIAGTVTLIGTLALVVALFVVPARGLVGVVGVPVIQWMYRVAALTPWSLEAWVHVLALCAGASLVWFVRPSWRSWQCVSLVIVFAIGLELAQLLSPARTPRLVDGALNALGVVLGIAIASCLLEMRRRWIRLRSRAASDQTV